jgi:hypothetical protein
MSKSFLPGPSVVTTKNQLGAVLKIGSQVIKLVGNVTGTLVGGEVVYTIGAGSTIIGTPLKILTFDGSGNLNTNSNLTFDAANNLVLINNPVTAGATNSLIYGFGNSALATTANGMVIGDSNSILGHIPIAMGRGLNCGANDSGGTPKIIIGQYNLEQPFSIFEIGFGTGTPLAQRKNAVDVHSLWGLTRLHNLCIKGENTTNGLSAGFKIYTASGPSYQKYSCGSDITSDLTEAVVSPNDATFTIGQIKIVENSVSSGGSLIFKNGANVRLPNNIDFALTPGSIITFIWNGSVWMTLSSSTN